MSQPMIGYLLSTSSGITGERGQAYDYILAANGLFLEAENQFIKARIRIGDFRVRGLTELNRQLELKHGMIPSYFPALMLSRMKAQPDREVYLALIWSYTTSEYLLLDPPQHGGAAQVRYDVMPNTVLDAHSHGSMSARFSHTDDNDDQGFRISIVIGRLDQPPAQMSLRIGIYGYHESVLIPQVFSGQFPTNIVVAQG